MLLVDFNFIENFNEIKTTDQLYERYPNLSVSGFFHQTRKSYDFKLFFFFGFIFRYYLAHLYHHYKM